MSLRTRPLGFGVLCGAPNRQGPLAGPGQVWVLTCIEIDKNLSSHDITDVVCGIDLSLRHESKFIYRVDVVPVSMYG